MFSLCLSTRFIIHSFVKLILIVLGWNWQLCTDDWQTRRKHDPSFLDFDHADAGHPCHLLRRWDRYGALIVLAVSLFSNGLISKYVPYKLLCHNMYLTSRIALVPLDLYLCSIFHWCLNFFSHLQRNFLRNVGHMKQRSSGALRMSDFSCGNETNAFAVPLTFGSLHRHCLAFCGVVKS